MSSNKVFKQNFGHGYFQFLILLIPFFNELFSYAIISLLSLKLTNSFQKMNAWLVTCHTNFLEKQLRRKHHIFMNPISCQGPRRRSTIMHCYQRGVIWLLTKYPWQWEWAQLEVWRIVIKKMLSCATLHLEQIWINIALRGHTHTKRKKIH